mmetsp:Transcript_22456/g.48855  ORF Transcript_22456/g.48855 Transcript_22456/m.48855 type:complete len:607 (+) Transcript_22456:196-2016(+)
MARTTAASTTSSSKSSRPFDEVSNASSKPETVGRQVQPQAQPQAQQPAIWLAPTTGKRSDRDRTLIGNAQDPKTTSKTARGETNYNANNTNKGKNNASDLEEGMELMYEKNSAHNHDDDDFAWDFKTKRRKRRFLIVFVLCCVVGIAAGLAAFFLLRNKNESNDTVAAVSASIASAPPIPSKSPSLAPTDSSMPTGGPSRDPSRSPTAFPSSPPSRGPTTSPTSQPTTLEPSAAPSAAPTRDYGTMLKEFLIGDYGVDLENMSLPHAVTNMLAVKWMAQEASQLAAALPKNEMIEFNEKLVQRFALLSMDFAMQDAKNTDDVPLNARLGVDECDWQGIRCAGEDEDGNEGRVTEVHWSHQSGVVGGRISPEVRLLAKNLSSLDLSNNKLIGTIPEEVYSAINLKKLYLFKNKLEGTISTRIGNLDSITHFHLSHNNLSGKIPNELKSDGSGIRPLEYFNLYSNQLTGTLPQNMRLRNVYYFDVGRNKLTGKLPEDIGEKFVSLRHLYFDRNNFRGTLPEVYNMVGNGRLESFSIDHNKLTGEVPGEREMYNKLVQYTLHSNRFDRIDLDNCRMEIPRGEMVEFRVDCDICRCNGYYDMCELQCFNN